jgi:hypothetical protein
VAARAIASSLVWSNAWITILTLGPLLMTVIFAFAGVRISSQFLLPVFFLVPAALLHHGAAVVDRRASSRLTSGAVAYTSLVLLAAPAIATVIFAFGLDPRVGEPRRQVAAEAQLIWREEVGRPLTIVAGQDRYARAVSFYSTDAPSEYAETDPRSTPWVSQDRIRREGLLFVCEVGTVYCSDVERLPVAPSVTIERSLSASFVGSLKPPRTIRFQIVRPQ